MLCCGVSGDPVVAFSTCPSVAGVARLAAVAGVAGVGVAASSRAGECAAASSGGPCVVSACAGARASVVLLIAGVSAGGRPRGEACMSATVQAAAALSSSMAPHPAATAIFGLRNAARSRLSGAISAAPATSGGGDAAVCVAFVVASVAGAASAPAVCVAALVAGAATVLAPCVFPACAKPEGGGASCSATIAPIAAAGSVGEAWSAGRSSVARSPLSCGWLVLKADPVPMSSTRKASTRLSASRPANLRPAWGAAQAAKGQRLGAILTRLGCVSEFPDRALAPYPRGSQSRSPGRPG
jgi:hypothetical protein